MTHEITERIEPNGYASLNILDGDGDRVVWLSVDDGYLSITIYQYEHFTPDMLAAIGRTFAQWAEVARERGVTL